MNQFAPQNPFFLPIKRQFLTEDELNAPINVTIIKVYGFMTIRGKNRKDVFEEPYEAEVEVPENYNKGHVKLAANRVIRKKLKGIRARTFHVDEEFEPKPAEHRRRVRDFMSDNGIRENERSRREYAREIDKRNKEAEALAAGILPSVTDATRYTEDGLAPFSNRTYVA